MALLWLKNFLKITWDNNTYDNIVSASTNKTVLLTQLSSGIYFVKVQNSFNKSSVKKLIIE